MESVWNNENECPSFEPLDGDKRVDVLIIGGGLAGLLCAYKLHEAGANYMLIESDRICSGTTKNTTAKITSQHGLIYSKINDSYGLEQARKYLEINEKAVNEYRKLCADIDCDFQTKESYIYSLDDDGALEREMKVLAKIGHKASLTSKTGLPFQVKKAIRFRNQAQFDPLKFAAFISRDLNVREHTMVQKIEDGKIITNRGKIKASKIIVATHFPFLNKHGSYFLKQYQHRSHVTSVKGAADVKGMYLDASPSGFSFRNYKDYLLIGGGGHRTGKPGDGWSSIVKFAHEYYPKAEITHHWAAQDCMTLDGIPYIGIYSKTTPDMYVATGFGKWGMTSSMVSAMILSDMVLGKENPYADVFNPSRNMMKKQLLINGMEAVRNLASVSKKRCSHMGCALKWNPQEQSWDCPCHGSRFTEEGEVIDNPAKKDI